MERSSEIEELVGEWFAAISRGDASVVDRYVTPDETEGYREGDVGWAATKLTVSFPDGKRIQSRWTAVLVRRDGWKFVQTHASIAVPNEEVGWT